MATRAFRRPVAPPIRSRAAFNWSLFLSQAFRSSKAWSRFANCQRTFLPTASAAILLKNLAAHAEKFTLPLTSFSSPYPSPFIPMIPDWRRAVPLHLLTPIPAFSTYLLPQEITICVIELLAYHSATHGEIKARMSALFPNLFLSSFVVVVSRRFNPCKRRLFSSCKPCA